MKKRKGKEHVQGKGEVEMLQEQIRDARNEVIESKLIFEELKKDISKQLDFYNEVADKLRKMIKRKIPLHRMMKNI